LTDILQLLAEMTAVEQGPQNWKELVATSPGSGEFLAGILMEAHKAYGDAGFGTEMEIPVARAVVHAFANNCIVGPEITRLIEYTGGDAQRAYDVLTIDEELGNFLAARNQESSL
jgi:hypothetical protein